MYILSPLGIAHAVHPLGTRSGVGVTRVHPYGTSAAAGRFKVEAAAGRFKVEADDAGFLNDASSGRRDPGFTKLAVNASTISAMSSQSF